MKIIFLEKISLANLKGFSIKLSESIGNMFLLLKPFEPYLAGINIINSIVK